MKKLFSKIFNTYEEQAIRVGRVKVRNELLGFSDRQLVDFGISRELLEAGISEWPWKIPGESSAVVTDLSAVQNQRSATLPAKQRQERAAVAELESLSDAELRDIGINRGSIVEAVRQGRYGIERVEREFDSAA